MNISAVSSPAAYVPQVAQRPPAAARAAAPVSGGDSDGDNDGSKGHSVDVKA